MTLAEQDRAGHGGASGGRHVAQESFWSQNGKGLKRLPLLLVLRLPLLQVLLLLPLLVLLQVLLLRPLSINSGLVRETRLCYEWWVFSASETQLSRVDLSAKETLLAAAAPTRPEKQLQAEKHRRQK